MRSQIHLGSPVLLVTGCSEFGVVAVDGAGNSEKSHKFNIFIVPISREIIFLRNNKIGSIKKLFTFEFDDAISLPERVLGNALVRNKVPDVDALDFELHERLVGCVDGCDLVLVTCKQPKALGGQLRTHQKQRPASTMASRRRRRQNPLNTMGRVRQAATGWPAGKINFICQLSELEHIKNILHA